MKTIRKRTISIVEKIKATTLTQRLFMGGVVFLFGTGLVITQANNAESVKQPQVKSDEKAFFKLQAKAEKKQAVKSENKEVVESSEKPKAEVEGVTQPEPEPVNVSTDTTAENVVTENESSINEMPSHGDISSVGAYAVTQYSHTENGHYEGQYYDIYSSQPTVTKSASGTTVSGTVSRSNIGLEKGSIVLDYTLNFDVNGCYVNGAVTSSGYVEASIALTKGQNYTGQTVNFISTTGGQAGSGSYVYPISAFITVG
ncbi:hypothetical protein RyT2_08020 [Pseudolactococcus yaeyamensis]